MNRTNIYLTQKQIEFLKSIKKDRGTNASETIRQLINKKMEEVDEQTGRNQSNIDPREGQGIT